MIITLAPVIQAMEFNSFYELKEQCIITNETTFFFKQKITIFRKKKVQNRKVVVHM